MASSCYVIADLEALASIKHPEVSVLPGRHEQFQRLVREEQISVAIVANMAWPLWQQVRKVGVEREEEPRAPSSSVIAILSEVASQLGLTQESLPRVRWLLALGDNRAKHALVGKYSIRHWSTMDVNAARQEMLYLASMVQSLTYEQCPPGFHLTCSVEPGWRLPRNGMIFSLMESWKIQTDDPIFFLAGQEKTRPQCVSSLICPTNLATTEQFQYVVDAILSFIPQK